MEMWNAGETVFCGGGYSGVASDRFRGPSAPSIGPEFEKNAFSYKRHVNTLLSEQHTGAAVDILKSSISAALCWYVAINNYNNN